MSTKNPLSDFEVMWARLDNWGRWGRQDDCRPDPECGSGSIYDMGKTKDRDDDESVVEEFPTRIDQQDGDLIDGYIRQLSDQHRKNIRTHFYLRRFVPDRYLNESVRMVIDLENGNMAVRTYLRGKW